MLQINYNLIFTVINLLVLYAVLRVVFFKPINRMLEERQAQVEQDFADAAKAKAEAEAAQSASEAAKSAFEASKELEMMQAQQRAAEEYDRILAAAQQEADGIVSRAAQEAQQERADVIEQTQRELTALVMEATAKVVVSGGAAEDAALYDQFLRTAEESDS